MTIDNLALWHSVEKTDPKHVKSITDKPYKGSSPKPHYLVMKATEDFGPCGIGWGFEILSQQFVNGAPGDILHVAHLRVWYTYNGTRGTVEHVGQTVFAGKDKNGPYTDEDAPKKSVTDALVKALSMVGFAGDIFMGRFDDSKYVAETAEEFVEASRPPSAARLYVDREKIKLAGFSNEADMADHWKKELATRKSMLDGTKDPLYIELSQAFAARAAEITKSLPQAAE